MIGRALAGRGLFCSRGVERIALLELVGFLDDGAGAIGCEGRTLGLEETALLVTGSVGGS